MTQREPLTTVQITDRCYSVIDKFAHREALREDDIRSWVSSVVGDHGEAAIWHATRAGGFGGSDIGVLVRNFCGQRADHMNSAHDIVASKLLRDVPSVETGDLRRGHDNEPLHAQKFYEKYGSVRDVAAFDLLSASSGLRSWMRYSPDDVVLMPGDEANAALGDRKLRRLLIDYKAPRRVEADDAIAFQYACQLHQGAMVCAKAGIHLDGLMLSQYDWANWALKDDAVAYDAELSKLILQSGDHYHDFVMNGSLPPYIMTKRFDDEEGYLNRFGMLAQRYAHISAVAKAFTEEADRIAKDLKEGLKGSRMAGKKLQMGDVTVTAVVLANHEKINELLGRNEVAQLRKKGATPGYDVVAMAQVMREMGCDPEQFRIDKVDTEKAYDYLVDRGDDPESFMDEQIRFTVAKHLKESAQDLVAQSYPMESVARDDEQDDAGGSSLHLNGAKLDSDINVNDQSVMQDYYERAA